MQKLALRNGLNEEVLGDMQINLRMSVQSDAAAWKKAQRRQ